MDLKSIQSGFNRVQSTPDLESSVQQAPPAQGSADQAAVTPQVETLSDAEKNSKVGQMRLQGGLLQANLNAGLDAQKTVPRSAKDVTNPANDGSLKTEGDHQPQAVESEFMDAVNAGIAQGRAEERARQQNGQGPQGPMGDAIGTVIKGIGDSLSSLTRT